MISEAYNVLIDKIKKDIYDELKNKKIIKKGERDN
jgi:DnaJ-class molecular chaperone